MLCLYRSGRQAEALETYQAARRALVDELGIEPGRELRELHQAILQQDPGLDLRRSARAGARDADAARSSAARPSSPSSSADSMMPSPAAGACSCSSASPASARAVWLRS